MIPADAALDPVPVGAFTDVKTGLRWVTATDPTDQAFYDQTRAYQ